MADKMEENGWNEFNRINVQSLFSWAVFTLAFLTAMIGILAFVHTGLDLSVLCVYFVVYLFLLLGLIGSLHVTIVILRVVRVWRTKFKEQHKDVADLFGLLTFPWFETWIMGKWNQRLVLGIVAGLSIAVFLARLYTN